MNNYIQSSLHGKAITPLWVIALFISLTETILGIGVIQTSGGIQIALTIFVLSFPLFIAGAFFFTLWKRPWVLYAPTEYSGGANVGDYVREMSGRPKPLDDLQIYSQIQQSIRDTLTSHQVITELSKLTSHNGKIYQEEVTNILNEAAESAEEKIRNKAFLTIDTRLIDNNPGSSWIVPYDSYDTISYLLDDIYFSLKGLVHPYTYGKEWILRDRASGRKFLNMGSHWTKSHNKNDEDRKLTQAGIKPGMILNEDDRKLAQVGIKPGMILDVLPSTDI